MGLLISVWNVDMKLSYKLGIWRLQIFAEKRLNEEMPQMENGFVVVFRVVVAAFSFCICKKIVYSVSQMIYMCSSLYEY